MRTQIDRRFYGRKLRLWVCKVGILIFCCKYDMFDLKFSRWQILPANPLVTAGRLRMLRRILNNQIKEKKSFDILYIRDYVKWMLRNVLSFIISFLLVRFVMCTLDGTRSVILLLLLRICGYSSSCLFTFEILRAFSCVLCKARTISPLAYSYCEYLSFVYLIMRICT